MLRLLIVDDEDIITDGLFEVFHKLMPDKLDVCKAYSGKEALQWLQRTRIDIVLTDISMPGMSGLELSEEIRMYWPRCKIVFLTGYSEFDYAYQAIQMQNARYLLKTEGYGKVTEVVQDVIREIHHGTQMSALVEQSLEQRYALEFAAQGDYIRHLLQESHVLCQDRDVLVDEFRKLNMPLEPTLPVAMVSAQLAYPEGTTYSERSEMVSQARMIWNSYFSGQTRHIGIVDKHGDLLWLLQPSEEAEEKFYGHLIRYLQGTLELISETCLESLNLTITFIIGSSSCEWASITKQAERLRQLQQMKLADGLPLITTDRIEREVPSEQKDTGRIAQKAEVLAAHLEAGKRERFYETLADMTGCMLHPCANVQRTVEAYYSIALVLLSAINRSGLQEQFGDYGKLMRLDEHPSLKEGIHYLNQIADRLFSFKQQDEAEKATSVIDRICQYIEAHLSEDLSLVRLAEINYFNPSYLSRFFKQEKGINLSEYIDQCRLRQAKELLKASELKVREVSVYVGYEAAHSFTRFFKKATGMTPQEYRDSYHAG
ncbi:response regulator transcription factor [Paenibacillus methanolicus]|uniref:Two-component system response regulator YesN n=1 Tax=Paenibacillus methanolicus TaxID=582686 RepID=A0A5S5CBX2_9BACL|nr:helix-turn-helix domain-containing protein [Paenibacillus methanolicus]TYP76837.1 two-component system response regulator YesN [Paenibacillus methanolicus]